MMHLINEMIAAGQNPAKLHAILVHFPIAISMSEAYGSTPGPTARRLGAYLLQTIYQGDVIVCALFLTGQISNVIIADFARKAAGIDLTYGRWALAAVVPGVVSLLLVPYLLFRVFPPELTATPGAAVLARTELRRMGPMTRAERLMLGVFVVVAGLWIGGARFGLNPTLVALTGVVILLVTGLLTWNDALAEHAACDVFIWFGGLVRMAEALNEYGVTRRFAAAASALTVGWAWWLALLALLLIYFYAHYGFASITAHVSAMFLPFVTVAIASGAPAFLTVAAFAFLSNLSATLTHYGTTPAPIYFSAGYMSQGTWWRLGLLASFITIPTWLILGAAWWKLLGWW